MNSTRRKRRSPALLILGAIVLFWLGGCVSPGSFEPTVVRRYQEAMVSRGPAERHADSGLESLAPARQAGNIELATETDEETGVTYTLLSLDEAIRIALANNLDIRVVSYDPAIAREQMVAAAAEFDYIVFGGINRTRSDQQTGTALAASESDERVFEFGVREKTITGAQWQAAWNMTRSWDNQVFTTLRTRWEPTLTFELTQPLLRDAWPEVNLARLRISRINYRASIESFRQRAEEIVNQVISTYWQLVQAREELRIQEDLVVRTEKTYQRVLARRKLDATDVEVMQSLSALKSREALVVRARKTVMDAEDSLAQLLNHPQVYVTRDNRVVPSTPLTEAPTTVDLTDQLLAALRLNPRLAQARLAIDAAAINVDVAENQVLPRLDFTGSATMQGLDGALNESVENLWTGDYVSYTFGITGEYPLGNRERLANLRRRRLERMQSVTDLQNAADKIAVQVKERVRQVQTTQLERMIQAESAEAARKETAALTELVKRTTMRPELLQLELQSFVTLASAEISELRATVNYNVAMADLARTTGTIFELHGVELAIPDILSKFPASGEGDSTDR